MVVDDEEHENQLLCDDILAEIFLRVPVESVFRFKCLSKSWNYNLSHTSFRTNYQIMRSKSPGKPFSYDIALIGLFQTSIRSNNTWPPLLSATCEDTYLNPPRRPLAHHLFANSMVRDKLGFFVGASNGLVLCGYHPSKYFVCNPITNQWFKLPQALNKTFKHKDVTIGFLVYDAADDHNNNINSLIYKHCDNNIISPIYKVVRASSRASSIRVELPIETYSSDTGVWAESVLRGAQRFALLAWRPCTAVGGIIYWEACGNAVVAYDPKNNSENSKDSWVWIINLPRNTVAGAYILSVRSLDGILLLGLNDYPGMKVYMLGKKPVHHYCYYTPVPESEWIQIHDFNCRTAPYPHYLITFHPNLSRFVMIQWAHWIYWFDLETGDHSPITCYGDVCFRYAWLLYPYFQPVWPPSPKPVYL